MPVWAGILLHFTYEMKQGDIVIAPIVLTAPSTSALSRVVTRTART